MKTCLADFTDKELADVATECVAVKAEKTSTLRDRMCGWLIGEMVAGEQGKRGFMAMTDALSRKTKNETEGCDDLLN